ncbi:hypothetical protein [Sphingobium sp. CAP-1]|uniref:hypothetical protein n=1 Tax=Sphingobium sp. CAP-1 TaxID=2676077 RepID=UPI001E3DE81D|nr:hypothetical protein [Sphingobium sp. CAP-1]
MPMHFWMATGGTMAVAAIMGVGLGNYVTSPQGRSPAAVLATQSAYDAPPLVDATVAAQTGPVMVHCTGCGPTLAERRWQADIGPAEGAGLDADGLISGGSDPVLRDYQAHELPEDILPDAAPSPIHQLPPQIARFAAGEAAPPTIEQTTIEAAPPAVATEEPQS